MQSQVLFQNQHYTAIALSTGLVVTSNKTGQGKMLVGDAFKEWSEAIKSAIDKDEAAALCRAVLRA